MTIDRALVASELGLATVDVEEEGHGLLRRRRMGSVLKEIDED